MVEMVNEKAERKRSRSIYLYLYSTLCNVKRSEISKDKIRDETFSNGSSPPPHCINPSLIDHSIGVNYSSPPSRPPACVHLYIHIYV